MVLEVSCAGFGGFVSGCLIFVGFVLFFRGFLRVWFFS